VLIRIITSDRGLNSITSTIYVLKGYGNVMPLVA
jgi:hypothetical protein